jgi:hypothetical protein
MRMKRASPFVLAVIVFLAAVPRCVAQAETSIVFRVLHAFSGGNDGGGLWGSLVLDGQGNLYGTTFSGGPGPVKGGTAFKLSPQPDGQWLLSTLHAFGASTDGGVSTAGMIFDSAGNLYGTTGLGGTHFLGTVFELIPRPNGGIPTERLNRLREASSETGVGLSGMRERLNELNGTLEIESDGHGTTMRAIVPVPAIARSPETTDCRQVALPARDGLMAGNFTKGASVPAAQVASGF